MSYPTTQKDKIDQDERKNVTNTQINLTNTVYRKKTVLFLTNLLSIEHLVYYNHDTIENERHGMCPQNVHILEQMKLK